MARLGVNMARDSIQVVESVECVVLDLRKRSGMTVEPVRRPQQEPGEQGREAGEQSQEGGEQAWEIYKKQGENGRGDEHHEKRGDQEGEWVRHGEEVMDTGDITMEDEIKEVQEPSPSSVLAEEGRDLDEEVKEVGVVDRKEMGEGRDARMMAESDEVDACIETVIWNSKGRFCTQADEMMTPSETSFSLPTGSVQEAVVGEFEDGVVRDRREEAVVAERGEFVGEVKDEVLEAVRFDVDASIERVIRGAVKRFSGKKKKEEEVMARPLVLKYQSKNKWYCHQCNYSANSEVSLVPDRA